MITLAIALAFLLRLTIGYQISDAGWRFRMIVLLDTILHGEEENYEQAKK